MIAIVAGVRTSVLLLGSGEFLFLMPSPHPKPPYKALAILNIIIGRWMFQLQGGNPFANRERTLSHAKITSFATHPALGSYDWFAHPPNQFQYLSLIHISEPTRPY